MIRAYPEIYVNRAMGNLGEVIDFTVNQLHIKGETVWTWFAGSTVCRRIENGEPLYLLGKSGVEIACEMYEEAFGIFPDVSPEPEYGRTPEYWCGWVLGYYQWCSSLSFARISRIITYQELLDLYPALHEADVTKVAEVLEEYRKRRQEKTNLACIRTGYGCTQRRLSEMSGVMLRSIQMYEQRQKDINKCQAETLYRLAKSLGCTMEDLLEE